MYRVVVGVDNSEGSAAAVRWCAHVAPMLDAEVVAVHALATGEGFPSDAEFDAWCKPLRLQDLPVRRVIQDADAARLLRQVAHDEDADLVVVGATHRGELSAFVLGSVVEGLAYHARRPVVIVPIPDADSASPAADSED